MEDQVVNLLTSPEAQALYMGIVGLFLVKVVTTAVSNQVAKYFALRRLKNNYYFRLNAKVQFPTADGVSKPMIIRSMTKDNIVLKDATHTWVINTVEAKNMSWLINEQVSAQEIMIG